MVAIRPKVAYLPNINFNELHHKLSGDSSTHMFLDKFQNQHAIRAQKFLHKRPGRAFGQTIWLKHLLVERL